MSKTPVTLLQELLLKKRMLPNFELIHNGMGTHEPLFKYQVSAGNKTAIGSGKSKKEAKHDSAQNLLNLLRSEESDLQELVKENVVEPVRSPYAEIIKDNAVGSLQEYCASRLLPTPEYQLTRDEGLAHAKIFCYLCKVSSFATEAQARTKKQAKQLAAQAMVEKLKGCVTDVVVPEFKMPDDIDLDKLNKDVADKLMAMGHHRFKSNPKTNQMGIKYGDLFNALDDYAQLKPSPKLEAIIDKPKEYFEHLDSPDEVFGDIVKELQFEEIVVELSTKRSRGLTAMGVQIRGPTTWTFVAASQQGKAEALRMAYVRGLKFLAIMCAP